MDNVVGYFSYDACYSCSNYRKEAGNCNIDAFDQILNFEQRGGHLLCLLYILKESPTKETSREERLDAAVKERQKVRTAENRAALKKAHDQKTLGGMING